jgi:hypothetical protein
MEKLIKKYGRHFLYTLLVAVFLTSCAEDKHKLDGQIIKVRGEYFRIENRMGNAYILEPVKIDSTAVILNDN